MSPPAALLFLACTLIFALWGFVDWRRDQRLAESGLDIRAQVVDRETRLEEE